MGVTGNTFTSDEDNWISYCVQIGSGQSYTIPEGSKFIVKDNDASADIKYEWDVPGSETKVD